MKKPSLDNFIFINNLEGKLSLYKTLHFSSIGFQMWQGSFVGNTIQKRNKLSQVQS